MLLVIFSIIYTFSSAFIKPSLFQYQFCRAFIQKLCYHFIAHNLKLHSFFLKIISKLFNRHFIKDTKLHYYSRHFNLGNGPLQTSPLITDFLRLMCQFLSITINSVSLFILAFIIHQLYFNQCDWF